MGVAGGRIVVRLRRGAAEEIREAAARRGKEPAELLEEYLEYIASSEWLEALAEDLGLEPLEPLDPGEVARGRPRGLDAARAVRELRDGRLGGPGQRETSRGLLPRH